jgi:hypothetical protein
MPALTGVSATGRLGLVLVLKPSISANLIVSIAGVVATARVQVAGLSIRDVLNATPNTASFTIKGSVAPTVGQAVQIGLGALDGASLLFAGVIQAIDQTYDAGRAVNQRWQVTAIDHTFEINKRRPFGTTGAAEYSASIIAAAMVGGTPGFTSAGIQASLPAVSVVFDGSADFMTCLGQMATAIGGYCYVDYLRDVHLFQTEATAPPDDLDSTPGRFLNDPPITVTTDLSQIRTRVYGKGHGEATPTDVAVGETIVPIADAVMFQAAGGQAIASTMPAGAQAMILDYTGVQLGGGGSLVGPGVQPSVAPTLGLAVGAGVTVGSHQWAYTWVTAAGETLPSPLRTLVVGTVTAPPLAAFSNFSDNPVGEYANGDAIRYKVTCTGDPAGGFTSEWPLSADCAPISPPPSSSTPSLPQTIVYFVNHHADTRVRWIRVWRNRNGGAYRLVKNIPNVPSAQDSYADDASGGTSIPTGNTTIEQVPLSAIAIGPAGVTSRKVYRTVAAGSQLKLQQTIANNTATTGVDDATADGSLGANAPTGDTSGLTQPTGQVNAGSTSLLTASPGPFATGGGWAILSGGQVLRYTGITGNTLTGIPASGVGAILTTVPYGSPVLPSPALTGVTGVVIAMLKGSAVHLWVQRNDLAAQAALVLLEGGDGIREYTLSDERRGIDSLRALCDADLVLFSRPIVTVTYCTRDLKTRSGKSVHVNLPAPTSVTGDFIIQDVTITCDAPTVAPRFAVTASSVRFTLEDVLRRLVVTP